MKPLTFLSQTLSLLCIGIGLGFAAPAMPAPTNTVTPLDRVVATVNNDIITESQVDQAMKFANVQMKMQHMSRPPADKLRSIILSQLIDQKLQLQIAAHNKIVINKAQVRAFMQAIAKQQRMSVRQWKAQLTQEGLSEQAIYSFIKSQLIISNLHAMLFGKSSRPSAREINKAKQELRAMQRSMQFYNLDDVLVPLPSNPTPAQTQQARNTAQSIVTQLRKGVEVDSIKGAEINKLGWKNANQLPTLFVNNLTNATAGAIIGPIKAANGYHVLKMVNLRSSGPSQISSKQAMEFAAQQKFAKNVEKWLKTLRKNAYIRMK